MARRVFFSFHYQRDIWRVSQIRNSWVTKKSGDVAGYWDHADWEKVEREGDSSIRRWINQQLKGASVTIVLIGAETATRPYVLYEIQRSYEMGKGLLGIQIHNMKDRLGHTNWAGDNPFSKVEIPPVPGSLSEFLGINTNLGSHVPIYNWVNDDGYNNLTNWVEAAAKKAGY
jgi:hypothetical protein